MRTLRILIILALTLTTVASIFGQANTVVAVKTGVWADPDIWSCKCLPKRTDTIIIPQGIIVSVMQTLMLGPSENGEALVVSVAGTLNISSGSVHIDPIDRIIVMPGGKVTSKSTGGAIISDIYALHLDGGTIARGPTTLSRNHSTLVIAEITAESDTTGLTLQWRSGTDIEVNYYHVLRSSDGIRFETIGKVDGRGSLKQRLYTFIDKTRPTGMVHYRIDLTNMNGVGFTGANLDVSVHEHADGPVRVVSPTAAGGHGAK